MWPRPVLPHPSLLAAAVAVVVDGISCLAVPVGGERRGGYIPVRDAAVVMLLRQALALADAVLTQLGVTSGAPDDIALVVIRL